MAEAQIRTRDGTWTFDLRADGGFTLISFEKAEPKPIRGLGDVVAAATSAVGIRPCAGCKKRQESLNRLLPFGDPPPPAAPPADAPGNAPPPPPDAS
jgi:hypothetical protein